MPCSEFRQLLNEMRCLKVKFYREPIMSAPVRVLVSIGALVGVLWAMVGVVLCGRHQSVWGEAVRRTVSSGEPGSSTSCFGSIRRPS